MENIIFIHPKRNRPSSVLSREIVRVAFSKINNRHSHSIVIYLGKNLAKKIGLSAGYKVSVGYHKKNKRNIFLKKSDYGFTLLELNGKSAPAFRIMFDWTIFTPKDDDFKLKEVRHEEIGGGIFFKLKGDN